MATDFLGNTINIGDEVIITELGYRNFITGIISKITPQYVFITEIKNRPNCKQYHYQVIVKKYITIHNSKEN